MILLDTNVISEILRPLPDARVLDWLKSYPKAEFWTTSIVIAEMLTGIERMPAGRKQSGLRDEVNGLIEEDFNGQILFFDLTSARAYAQIFSKRQRCGRPISQLDAQIAAIALTHRATLATRNERDFEDCEIQIINPWKFS